MKNGKFKHGYISKNCAINVRVLNSDFLLTKNIVKDKNPSDLLL